MKRPLKTYASLAFTALTSLASATTALIDFGRADAAALAPYNSAVVINGITGDVALLDTDSTDTGWTVSVTENGSGNGGSAGAGADVTEFPADLAGFEASALGDSVFANQAAGNDPSMALLFTGLAPSGSYHLLLYGSRANGQGLDQRWSLTQGTGGADVDQNSELNSSIYVDWAGVRPNENGEIEVTINSPGPDRTGALALNFASLTETTDVQLITSFTTDTESASSENPATLSWEVIEPFDSFTLDDGNGNNTDLAPLTTAGAGSTTVTPSETTTYSIIVVQGENSQTFSLTIFSGEAPQISSFTSFSNVISQGSSVDLNWEVVGASSLTLDPGATDVTGTTTINLTPAETTTYTLTATNDFGSTTEIVPVEVLAGPMPTNRNIASSTGNTDGLWLDQIGNRNWTMTGALRNSPLTAPSQSTNINAAYTIGGADNGGSTDSYQYAELTAEIWFRPGTLTADHQTIFETGGGQNGIGALITDTAIRLIGTAGNVRNVDVTLPTAGLNLDDFIQLVISNNSATSQFTASVRDTFGNVLTVSETADVLVGVNGAGIFIRASGALGGVAGNLGGSTDTAAEAPAGRTEFTGEIAIINVYDSVLETADIESAFSRVATVTQGITGLAVTAITFDTTNDDLTLTWNSISGKSYSVEFSTSLKADEWFNLDGPFIADSRETTETVSLPADRPRFFVRVLENTP
ncbi:hypothetical protein N9B42_02695 [Akkermansiaceae bacterium]|nr:hypothetical protein [Akkermansiaceae bacterium]